MRDRPDQPLSDRKTRDRALILPVLGAVLLMPPLAGIFRLDAKIGGLPVGIIYVFLVWALLIAGAALLAPRLRDGPELPDGSGATDRDAPGAGDG